MKKKRMLYICDYCGRVDSYRLGGLEVEKGRYVRVGEEPDGRS
jgi:hypothetical protein